MDYKKDFYEMGYTDWCNPEEIKSYLYHRHDLIYGLQTTCFLEGDDGYIEGLTFYSSNLSNYKEASMKNKI